MKFIFDECISYRIPQALDALGVDAKPYFNEWARGAEDLVWIPVVSAKNMCIVTSDKYRRPHERMALRDHNARVIVLATRQLLFWDEVRLVINRWKEIEKVAAKRKPPYMVRFTVRSRKPQVL